MSRERNLRDPNRDGSTAASERDALPYGGHFGGFPYGAAESGLAPWWDEEEDDSVLGYCSHGVNLDREFCPKGCRV